MDKFKHKNFKHELRHKRVRSKISGTGDKPRLAVFRSDKHIYAQVIDDVTGKTLAGVSDLDIKSGKKSDKAVEVGKRVAQKAIAAGVKEVSFDRGGFKYH